MELQINIRFDEEEGPRFTRKRISELLGGLDGLNTFMLQAKDLGAFDSAVYVSNRLTSGEWLDLKFLDQAIEVLSSMRQSALERSTPAWWRKEGCPPGHELDLAATFLQNADRVAEVMGMVKDLREKIVRAQETLGITVPSPV